MRAFVAMRHFLVEDATLLERLRGVELNQAAFQRFGIDLIQDEELAKMLVAKLKLLDEHQTA